MTLTLVAKKQETNDTASFIWKGEAPIAWTPGQYLHYVLPHKNHDDRKEERWFTISSAPHEGHVMLTTRIIEKSSSFKRVLDSLPVGAAVEADDPEGDFIVDNDGTEMVFIAGGIGITPFRAILRDLDYRKMPFKVTLLYGNRDPNFVFKQELDEIASRNPGFKINYIISPDQIDEAKIREVTPNLKKPIFYVSGPEPMVESFEKTMLAMGIPDEHIKRDFFPGYNWP